MVENIDETNLPLSFAKPFGLTSGAFVRDTVSLILVKKSFNCFNFFIELTQCIWFRWSWLVSFLISFLILFLLFRIVSFRTTNHQYVCCFSVASIFMRRWIVCCKCKCNHAIITLIIMGKVKFSPSNYRKSLIFNLQLRNQTT